LIQLKNTLRGAFADYQYHAPEQHNAGRFAPFHGTHPCTVMSPKNPIEWIDCMDLVAGFKNPLAAVAAQRQ
jgi:hypothetical protein